MGSGNFLSQQKGEGVEIGYRLRFRVQRRRNSLEHRPDDGCQDNGGEAEYTIKAFKKLDGDTASDAIDTAIELRDDLK